MSRKKRSCLSYHFDGGGGRLYGYTIRENMIHSGITTNQNNKDDLCFTACHFLYYTFFEKYILLELSFASSSLNLTYQLRDLTSNYIPPALVLQSRNIH